MRANNERGSTLVELALLVALIAAVCAVAVTFLSGASNSRGVDELRDDLTDLGLEVEDGSSTHYNAAVIVGTCRVELVGERLSEPTKYVSISGLPDGVQWAVDDQLPGRLESLCDTMERFDEKVGGS